MAYGTGSYCSSEPTRSSENSWRFDVNSQSKLMQSPATRKRHYFEGPSHNASTRRRLVFKNGQINSVARNVTDRHFRLLQSLFTTLVDMQWRWILLILALSFFVSWFSFALIWWLIALVHGDLEEPPDAAWIPCVTGIKSFTSSFLFSMENQHTTGFGSRIPTEECPEAIFVMCIQAIFGVTMQTAIVGVVLAKISRPKQRQNTLLFSNNAVVCRRDGALCLMIRIGDLQKSRLIGANLKLQFVITSTIADDEVLSPFRGLLKLNSSMTNFNLIWPEMVIHRIDKDSPLYDLSAEEMIRARFEIVAILEGTLESTNQRIHAMTSFLPKDIMWGHRFSPVIDYNEDLNSYEVDYKMFDGVYREDTPMCSAKELAALQEEFVNKSTAELLTDGHGGDEVFYETCDGPQSVVTM